MWRAVFLSWNRWRGTVVNEFDLGFDGADGKGGKKAKEKLKRSCCSSPQGKTLRREPKSYELSLRIARKRQPTKDGRLMADADAGEFWALVGGFAPLPKKTSEDKSEEAFDIKFFRFEKGKTVPTEVESLTRELLESNKCYLLDCGIEIFIWIGKSTDLEDRKSACAVAEDLARGVNRAKAHVIRVMEGFETVMFRSKFDSWPQTSMAAVSEDGRGKVAALLKLQGLDVKGLVKSVPVKEVHDPYIDCSGNLKVWRVNGQENILLPASDQSKLYTGDCYVFQYAYLGVDGEEYLIGTWLGRKSTEDDRTTANLSANRMVMSLKSQAVQARIYEGKEPLQFCAIFQRFTVLKGGLSSGYKNHIAENNIVDDTYTENGTALFRVQGSGPDNMQAIQVDVVGSFLNSSYCFILHSGDTLYTWSGSLTTSEDQDLLERQLDVIKPDLQYKPLKDGAETEQFWDLLGGKMERSNKIIATESESDPHLFCCFFSEGTLKVNEVFNFTQDDIMTEDVFILDCHSSIFVWVGQQVDSKKKSEALNIGEEFLKLDVLLENLSRETPIFIISEGSEPQFFTRFFSWDSSKLAMHGNSYQRKLALVKHGIAPVLAVLAKIEDSLIVSLPIEDLKTRGRITIFSPPKSFLISSPKEKLHHLFQI
ncbi:hypothetical protein HPP92_017765 [Vanilla planifolia]|uniref:Gelsolin-like domain-containing protein n=1 Tax=Vanilla planifolia TaxID=51239 RepID=A0A835QG41_VANPL|nr:hypothetical protein HPP92_017765 [Vanilla planifolia]